jgi:rapamycin-insensitive companion of mTOR
LTALSSIDSLNRNQLRVRQSERSRNNKAGMDSVMRGQRSVNASKLKGSMGIEDKAFQQMIVDSNVSL